MKTSILGAGDNIKFRSWNDYFGLPLYKQSTSIHDNKIEIYMYRPFVISVYLFTDAKLFRHKMAESRDSHQTKCTLPSFPRIRELRNLSSRLPSSTIAFLGRSDISFQVCCIARKRILYSLDGVGKKRWHGGVVPIGGTTPARKTSTD